MTDLLFFTLGLLVAAIADEVRVSIWAVFAFTCMVGLGWMLA